MTTPDSHVHTSRVMASLYRWFSVEKPGYLPDPDAEKTEDKAAEVREVNKAVLVELGKKRNRPSSYNYYDPELRAKIGKFAATSGNKAAMEKYSKELGRPVSESTVRGMKKAYYAALKVAVQACDHETTRHTKAYLIKTRSADGNKLVYALFAYGHN